MFQKAYEIANKYTKPLVVAFRFFDKTIDSGLGSFIILNEDGWIMTVAHNLEAPFAFHQHQVEYKEYAEKLEKINTNTQIKQSQKKGLIRTLKVNNKWVMDFLIWFGVNDITILEYYVYGEHDIAFIRIDKKFIEGFTDFPKIKDPSNFKFGTSLCKLGYPFCPVNATFDESTKVFTIPPTSFPPAVFPIEGIYTRDLVAGKSKDELDIIYLETSSPGLKGQSGGPIFDVEGNIYAVQSKTITMDLGFKGEVEINKKIIQENQFINVGIGVHAKTLIELMVKHNINFNMVS